MPYKDPQKMRDYQSARYQRMRKELIAKLGGVCSVDGCEETEDLEIHHIVPFETRSRTNAKAYFEPNGKELRCKKDHSHTDSWRRKRKR